MDHQLGNAIAAGDPDRVLPQIDKHDTDLAAVIGIDRPGTVQQRQPVTYRQPTPRSELGFETGGKLQGDPRRYQSPAACCKFEFTVDYPNGTSGTAAMDLDPLEGWDGVKKAKELLAELQSNPHNTVVDSCRNGSTVCFRLLKTQTTYKEIRSKP